MAERTGSLAFIVLWSIARVIDAGAIYVVKENFLG